jgi:GNAT superfamily N-acetyltransferase
MEIRLIANGEDELCNEFYNRINHKHRRIDQWKWEFTENIYSAHAEKCPFAVVVDNGKIVGTQAFIPIRMIDKNGVFWTAKSEETLVDPNYRGKQLFEKMYKLLFAYAQERQFRYIWGFTPAVKAFDRLGFVVPGKTRQLFMPFSVRSVPALLAKEQQAPDSQSSVTMRDLAAQFLCLKARGVSQIQLSTTMRPQTPGLRVEAMTQCDDQTGDLCRRFIDRWGGVTIYRDNEYLSWRIFNNPYNRCTVKGVYSDSQLVGWIAYTMGDDGIGYLVDIMVAPPASDDAKSEDIIKLLLLEAVRSTRRMGASGPGWPTFQVGSCQFNTSSHILPHRGKYKFTTHSIQKCYPSTLVEQGLLRRTYHGGIGHLANCRKLPGPVRHGKLLNWKQPPHTLSQTRLRACHRCLGDSRPSI